MSETRAPGRAWKVISKILSFVIPMIISIGIGWLIGRLAQPLSPDVDALLKGLALPQNALWQKRFWQLVAFLAGLLVSMLVGLMLNPRRQRVR